MSNHPHPICHDVNLFRSATDCQQVFNFNTGVEFHKQCACCVMPASIFVEAVLMAQGERKEGLDFEDYPSVKLICNWWNEHNPGRLHKAAFFFLNIRVEDNNIYFSGYGETPASYSDVFSENAPYSAMIGDHILIEFFASIPSIDEGEITYSATSVDGKSIAYDLGWVGYGFPHGSYDTWHSLRDFPRQFPMLFQYLCSPVTSPQSFHAKNTTALLQ
jgi:hypothetical protein